MTHGIGRLDADANGAGSLSELKVARAERAGDGIDGRRDRAHRARNDDGLEARLGSEVDRAGHVDDRHLFASLAETSARRRPDDRDTRSLGVALDDGARLARAAGRVHGLRDEDVRSFGEGDVRLVEGRAGSRRHADG